MGLILDNEAREWLCEDNHIKLFQLEAKGDKQGLTNEPAISNVSPTFIFPLLCILILSNWSLTRPWDNHFNTYMSQFDFLKQE